MSDPTLAERFRTAGASVVELDGVDVHSVFALPVPGRTTLRIVRTRTNLMRPQALRLAAAVPLEVNGRRATDLALRAATAPDIVEVLVDAVDSTVVYLWNTWHVDGIEHAWLGNSGMRIELDLTATTPVVRVACSDGVGRATFDDLVLAISLLPTRTDDAVANGGTAVGATAS